MTLRLFWIEIGNAKQDEAPSQDPLGIGVTAADELDAFGIVLECFYRNRVAPPEALVKAISSLNDLDQNPVRPNMGNYLRRGVWFPSFEGWQ